ncbi:MAG TPA: hypothetical protein VMH61_05410 [Candidatus Acidoferrales bacterium]|nr:hypothetical protein [Candidatus Acidoferrales bacterium]
MRRGRRHPAQARASRIAAFALGHAVVLAVAVCPAGAFTPPAPPDSARATAPDTSSARPAPLDSARAIAPDSFALPSAQSAADGPPRPAASPEFRADSARSLAEVGVLVESSNELFYEDVYTDTTFLGRRLHGTPETHAAAVAAFDVARRDGRSSWAIRPDLELGDAVLSASSSAAVRVEPDPRWRFALDPGFELTRDQRYGLDRREARVGSTGRIRRLLDSGEDAAEVELGGDLLATPGSTDPYLLAHRTALAGLTWDHHPLLGWDASLRGTENLRAFPDSTNRNHVEHQLEVDLHRDFDGGQSLTFAGELDRRVTLVPEISSRDRYVTVHAELGGQARFGDRDAVTLALEGEDWRYDQPDSVIDFDYTVLRGRLSERHDLHEGLSVSAGPRLEWLAAAWNPAEPYVETAGELSAEWFTPSRWWLLSPAGGWRAYSESESGPGPGTTALHSSYAFAELNLMVDQTLRRRLRLRLLLDARIERHIDPAQDTRSLYFSFDLRRLL